MPNIRSQRVSKDEIYIQASDGREVTITRDEIQTYYATQTSGNAASRKAATIARFKSVIETALGPEQVPTVIQEMDFDQANLNAAVIFGIRG